jgi:hypothetical protein
VAGGRRGGPHKYALWMVVMGYVERLVCRMGCAGVRWRGKQARVKKHVGCFSAFEGGLRLDDGAQGGRKVSVNQHWAIDAYNR